jgi:hypothetical protein
MNCVQAIGKPWKCDECFGNHAFAMMATKIFDACMAVDDDTDPTSASSTSFRWLTDITWPTYQSLVMLPGHTPGTPTQYAYTID